MNLAWWECVAAVAAFVAVALLLAWLQDRGAQT